MAPTLKQHKELDNVFVYVAIVQTFWFEVCGSFIIITTIFDFVRKRKIVITTSRVGNRKHNWQLNKEKFFQISHYCRNYTWNMFIIYEMCLIITFAYVTNTELRGRYWGGSDLPQLIDIN